MFTSPFKPSVALLSQVISFFYIKVTNAIMPVLKFQNLPLAVSASLVILSVKAVVERVISVLLAIIHKIGY